MTGASAAMSGVEAWNRFVEAAGRDIRRVHEGVGRLEAEDEAGAGALAHLSFRVGLSSLLVGAEELGRLALAVERALDAMVDGRIAATEAARLLAEPAGGLLAAIEQLENADKSGARIEGLSLPDLTATLEAALPAPAGTPPPIPRAPAPAPIPAASSTDTAKPLGPAAHEPPPTPGRGFVWAPVVDDDMVELFFEEATERIDGISGKLLDLERRGGDAELLRDLFRDLHTLKGSSAMVGLEPVNRLAHASEDLVGQLRDGERAVDAPIVSALLGALDGLKEMLELARSRRPIATDPAPILRRLRDPGAPADARAAPALPAREIAAPAREPAETPKEAHAPARQTIRVDFDKLDRLLNLVGELVLGRDGLRTATTALSSVTGELSTDRAVARRIGRVKEQRARRASGGSAGAAVDQGVAVDQGAMQELTEELGRVERVLSSITSELDASTGHLDSISSELRDQVMRLRMIPVGGVFRKHQRTVRDLGQALGKRVALELSGEDTELDKVLVEALDEPLLHLVRNAVDHGVELPEDRARAGKPAEGKVVLQAAHRGNQVVVRIADDGRGMNPQRLKQKALDKKIITEGELETMDDRAALELVFRPGFSTAATVSDVSGRGVGMDVVRQTIVTRLKGTIDIESVEGKGSAFTLRLPLTLAIIQVLLARVAGESFAIPLDTVARTIAIRPSDVALVGDREVIEVDNKNIALIRLAQVLELAGHDEADDHDGLFVVLTEQGGETFALACERLLGKKEIVIKSLGSLLSSVPCAAGATLLGDRCAIILDVPAIIQRSIWRLAPAVRRGRKTASKDDARAQILLVDDSDTIRESLRRLLTDAGYAVTTAEDGRVGLEMAKSRRFDLVSTDVMMPHMDGYELTRALRSMDTYKDVPIVMVTSRGERIDRVRGFDAGVDDYITKPHDRRLLLQSIQRLLGHGKETGSS